MMEMIPVEVVGVRIEMPSNQPIVLLKELNGSRFLPIWVGAVEATAIAFAQQGLTPGRPMTHDLLRATFEEFDATVTAVHITELREGVFYSTILSRDSQAKGHAIDARPSDAIALALRLKANILVGAPLMDEAGIEIPTDSTEEGDVEKFREFLDQINPEDFAG